MQRVIKWLIVAGFLGVLAGTGSFAGAWYAAGRLLGPDPPVAGRTTTFAYRGVESLPSKPRAWVFTYSQVRLPGVGRVRIFVSPRGRVLATQPADLGRRLEAYERSREP